MCEAASTEKHILVVEDDEKLTREMVETFTGETPAYKVSCASGSDEALNAIRETSFDLMLLDTDIAGINAFETMKKIREISDIPTVFLISDKNAEVISSVTQAGAADYITKPFLSAVLREIVYSVINN